ncbi:MAG: DUF6155 family protein [Porphyromonadaceae bacterium]|nr:DUF6155 family protein [Porphyromonadaceae bacterium]
MSKTRLKKEFQRLPKEQLVDQISDLYNKNKSVKESSDFYLNPKNKKVLAEKFKKLIRSEFNVEYPECGGRNFAKRAISDFRNFATFNRRISRYDAVFVKERIRADVLLRRLLETNGIYRRLF